MELKSYFPDKANPSQAKAKKAAEKFIADYPAVGGSACSSKARPAWARRGCCAASATS